MSKQLVGQRFIFKIRSGRLRRAKWSLTLPLAEARKNDEIISLADSQILRWIDELNGVTDAEARAVELRREIRAMRNDSNGASARRAIKKLYEQLDAIQFKPDYMCLIIDKEKDYRRACRGFSINGVSYVRLLGTNGGVKNETIVFVSARLADELRRRIDNGRDMTKELIPAKLEAYKALTCSASIPVSDPCGVIVVNDCETRFKADTVYLDDEGRAEPLMEQRPDTDIVLDATDGCGMMLPSLAARWSDELRLDYVMSGANTRNAWEKGMVFTFDFVDFAEKEAGRYIIKDAWGHDRDVRDAELILTTSMLKLWDSYGSYEEYEQNCRENHYTFSITKTCPKTLENEHTTNYQFVQPLYYTKEDIDRLIRPTMDQIEAILTGEPMTLALYLKGRGISERSILRSENDWIKGLMIEPALIHDTFIKSKIFYLIRNRINRAKVGVLNIHGNYSIASGDLYALCQSMFNMEITGIMKAGEVYNRYWCENDADDLLCFRAPMSDISNIRMVHPCRSQKAAYWFQYMPTATVLNCWDTICQALNGMDFDGDIVMLTDNPVLIKAHRAFPALMCVQRKAQKCVVTEDDAITANINSFGDDIGKTTNWITSMYEVRSRFPQDSEEARILNYRIACGQLWTDAALHSDVH